VKQTLSSEDIALFGRAFTAEPKNRLALNAVTRNGIGPVALNREILADASHTFSDVIETPEATDQKKSGRCWLFAGLNALRVACMERLKLDQFELSQVYLMFWDKLEKANFFIENIIETRDEPLNGRLVMWLLANALPDAGQWDMFVNLVKKYGVVPKNEMPETESSNQSASMNGILLAKLREYARDIREMNRQGASVDEMRERKQEQLLEFYRMLAIHLGTPPKEFLWEWRDKNKQFHRHGKVTPLQFFREFVAVDLDEMVCLINAPTEDKPYNKLYTVQYLGNVVGGRIVRYLNTPVDVLKNAAAKMILDGKPVWFGCDVGKMLERSLGILNDRLYDFELVFDSDFRLDKAGRLDYGHSKMNHAMVLTGVDLDDSGNPLRWRVENSWGKEIGDKGYMVMSDRWFDEYLYEITVSRNHLSRELQEVLETEPAVLPPWDPMGALAL
jgi:bleomycin hydrolase